MSEELIPYAYVDGSDCVSVVDPMLEAREEDLDCHRPEDPLLFNKKDAER